MPIKKGPTPLFAKTMAGLTEKSRKKPAKKASSSELAAAVAEAQVQYERAIEVHKAARKAAREMEKEIERIQSEAVRGDNRELLKIWKMQVDLLKQLEADRRSAAREEAYRKRRLEDAAARATVAALKR